MDKQVAIMGAGISGLLACKYILSKGFRPIVFKSASTVGGVWTKTVETTQLQTPTVFFQFSYFPRPSSVKEDNPYQNQVLEYVQSYACHFDLLKHIKFNTEVCGIEYEGPSEEEMRTWSLWGGTGEPFSSEGDAPNIPEFTSNKGPEAFHGKVIHSMEYADIDYESASKFVTGKQVTIVGSLKFAMDIAMECSNANEQNTGICQISFHGVCLLHYSTSIASRSSWFISLAKDSCLSLLAILLSPLRWAYSKFVETYANNKLGLYKYGMVPKQTFLEDISSGLVALVPEKFYDRVQEGSIILKKSPRNFGFCEEGILVEGEVSPLKTELVILATGFTGEKKLKDIFVSPTFQNYITGPPEAILPLYRHCINGRIPQLAVIGISESISNLYTSEMNANG